MYAICMIFRIWYTTPPLTVKAQPYTVGPWLLWRWCPKIFHGSNQNLGNQGLGLESSKNEAFEKASFLLSKTKLLAYAEALFD